MRFSASTFSVALISIADQRMECASHLLSDDGVLLIYGPFRSKGVYHRIESGVP